MATITTTTQVSFTLSKTETEQHVLKLIMELEDPESWLHRRFYGDLGVMPTPMEPVYDLPNGHAMLLKNETTHTMRLHGTTYRADSFKRRGALLAGLLAWRANPSVERFVTASHGNHGIGVAMAARTLGVKAEIYCPESVNSTKLKKLVSLGASVHTKGLSTFEDAMNAATHASLQKRAVLIHPFDQVEVIAGQASIGLEIVHDLVRMATTSRVDLHKTPIEVDVAVAGGGLLTGVAIVLRRYKELGILGTENVHLVGAQMVGCDAARRSTESMQAGGDGVAVFHPGEFNEACDSTSVREAGRLTLPFMADKTYVQGFRVVSEAETGWAMHALTNRYHKLVEPAGALAYASVRQQASRLSRRSGGNLVPTLFVVPVCGANVTRETYDYFQACAYGSHSTTLLV